MRTSPLSRALVALRRVLQARRAYSLALGLCLLATLVSHPAAAQTAVNSSTTQIPSSSSTSGGSATSMWGTGAGGSSGATASSTLLDSATMHETLGESAALVNSAKHGFLYSSGTSIVLESIGSQSIVSTSIYGDNNVADISANQTSTNNGNVNANGSITLSGNATTTTTTTTPGSSTSGSTSSSKQSSSSSSSAGSTASTTTTVGAAAPTNIGATPTNVGTPPTAAGP
jgi:hypothetical protein